MSKEITTDKSTKWIPMHSHFRRQTVGRKCYRTKQWKDRDERAFLSNSDIQVLYIVLLHTYNFLYSYI